MATDNVDGPIQAGFQAEYKALRDEILKRLEFRNQIVIATLTLAGVALSFGLRLPAIAFVVPVITTFLAAVWAQHDARIWEIGNYIRDHLEPRFQGLGWEVYRQNRPYKATRVLGIRLAVLSAGGLFVAMQVVALIIGFSGFIGFTVFDWVLGAVASVFTLFTLAVLIAAERRKTRK